MKERLQESEIMNYCPHFEPTSSSSFRGKSLVISRYSEQFQRGGKRKVSYHPLVERNYFSCVHFRLGRGEEGMDGIQGGGKVPNCSSSPPPPPSPPFFPSLLRWTEKGGKEKGLQNPPFSLSLSRFWCSSFSSRRSGNFSCRFSSPVHQARGWMIGQGFFFPSRSPSPSRSPPESSKEMGEEPSSICPKNSFSPPPQPRCCCTGMGGGEGVLPLMADHKDHSVISFARLLKRREREGDKGLSLSMPVSSPFSLDSIALYSLFCAGAV